VANDVADSSALQKLSLLNSESQLLPEPFRVCMKKEEEQRCSQTAVAPSHTTPITQVLPATQTAVGTDTATSAIEL
jgi:hypothetical protein